MTNNLYVAFLVITISIAIGRLMIERSRSVLSSDQKLAVLETLSPIRKYGLIYMVVFVLLLYKGPLPWMIWGTALTIIAGYSIKWILLRRIQVPVVYFKAITLEACICTFGAIAFVLLAFLMPPGV